MSWRDDDVRLRHMLDAGREAISYTKARSRQDLDIDRMLVHSLVRCIEIIGEAAVQTSNQTRQSYPDMPWQAMTAMRNRLIHAYFDIDLDRVWDTVKDDLPPLMKMLEVILKE